MILKDGKCYNNFIYIILKACHGHLSFLEIKNVLNKIGSKPDGGQFANSQKTCVFVMLSLSG